MNERLTLVTPPTVEPVTLGEAKVHCRVEHDADDALILNLIPAARRVCESRLRRALCTQTWDWTLDAWPVRDVLRLPLSPLVSVTSITYVDGNGTTQTISGSAYRVVTGTPGTVEPRDGTTWPTPGSVIGSVTIRFVAGYGAAAAVPAPIKAAMLLLIGNWHANREAVVIGTISSVLPAAVDALLASEDPGIYT